MSQAKAYSIPTGEVLDLGVPSEDLDELLAIGEFSATGHDNVVVFVDGPALQKWSD